MLSNNPLKDLNRVYEITTMYLKYITNYGSPRVNYKMLSNNPLKDLNRVYEITNVHVVLVVK